MDNIQEISSPIKTLVFLLKKSKTIVFFGLLFSIIFFFINLFFIKDIYKVDSILQNTTYNNTGSSSQNGLSSLAALGGINLNTNNSLFNEKIIVKTIKTRSFFNMLLESDKNIKQKIYASYEFDFKNNELILDSRLYDAKNQKWLETISLQEIHEEFLKSLSIKYNLDDNLIYISYEHVSPYFAEELINKLVDVYNTYYKTKQMKESKEAIDFFNTELINNKNDDLKSNISILIQKHLQEKMFASIKPALTFIEEPFRPDKSASAGKLFYILLGFIFGVMFGSFYVLFAAKDILKIINDEQ